MNLINKPLRELMSEAAELHKNMNTENPRQIRAAISSVKHALLNRHGYNRFNY